MGDAVPAIPSSGGQGGAMCFKDAESRNTYQTLEMVQVRCKNRKIIASRLLTPVACQRNREKRVVQRLRERFSWEVLKVNGLEDRWLYVYDGGIEMATVGLEQEGWKRAVE
jgi:hypothetical protein